MSRRSSCGDESNGRRNGVYTTFELIEIKFKRKLAKEVAALHMSSLLSANLRWREGGKAAKDIVSGKGFWKQQLRNGQAEHVGYSFHFFPLSSQFLSSLWLDFVLSPSSSLGKSAKDGLRRGYELIEISLKGRMDRALQGSASVEPSSLKVPISLNLLSLSSSVICVDIKC